MGISFVNRTIPIYAGVVTKKIIMSFYKSTKHSIENNFAGLNWHTFRTGDILNIKGLKVVPFHVDHSIPAAYGFIVYRAFDAAKIVNFEIFAPYAPRLDEILTSRSLPNLADAAMATTVSAPRAG